VGAGRGAGLELDGSWAGAWLGRRWAQAGRELDRSWVGTGWGLGRRWVGARGSGWELRPSLELAEPRRQAALGLGERASRLLTGSG